MRVLLDENLPTELANLITGHDAQTVAGLGWAGVKNGELLRRANGLFDALLTMDRNLEFQQKVSALTYGIVVIRARSNRLAHLEPLIPDIVAALESLHAGELRKVGT